VIGQIAQITPNKGQDIFIRALAQVVRIHPNVRGLIVGGNTIIDDSDWFLDELKQLVKELGLVDKVIFTGFVKNMVNLYRCLDLVVLPSKSEGFGRTIAEAMAMTKPAVATKVGGLQEIIVEGKTGLLVPPGDSKALADAILKVVENPELARKFGINGRKRVEELFTVESNVKKTEQVYKSLIVD
jgi:glycosyltransferase involved in cell wall biosynthesis